MPHLCCSRGGQDLVPGSLYRLSTSPIRMTKWDLTGLHSWLKFGELSMGFGAVADFITFFPSEQYAQGSWRSIHSSTFWTEALHLDRYVYTGDGIHPRTNIIFEYFFLHISYDFARLTVWAWGLPFSCTVCSCVLSSHGDPHEAQKWERPLSSNIVLRC